MRSEFHHFKERTNKRIVPSVKMKFVEGEDNDFSRFDEVGDAAWNGMIPSTVLPISSHYPTNAFSLIAESDGAGYVRVDRPRPYDMESSVPYGLGNEVAEVYQASVVHQLHCLVHSHPHLLTPSPGHAPPRPRRLRAARAVGELLRQRAAHAALSEYPASGDIVRIGCYACVFEADGQDGGGVVYGQV
jgi:hypothetical protein